MLWVALSSDQVPKPSNHRKTSLSVNNFPPVHPTPYPPQPLPALQAKQYFKLTKTINNAEYSVPKNSPSIKHSCLSNRCPSKSKIRNTLNLTCPKCPSSSLGHFGHPPHKIPRKSLTSNVHECEQTKPLQFIQWTVRYHQTCASVHAPLQTTKFNLGREFSILLR